MKKGLFRRWIETFLSFDSIMGALKSQGGLTLSIYCSDNAVHYFFQNKDMQKTENNLRLSCLFFPSKPFSNWKRFEGKKRQIRLLLFLLEYNKNKQNIVFDNQCWYESKRKILRTKETVAIGREWLND